MMPRMACDIPHPEDFATMKEGAKYFLDMSHIQGDRGVATGHVRFDSFIKRTLSGSFLFRGYGNIYLIWER